MRLTNPQKRPVFHTSLNAKFHRLAALVPVTEELLEDTAAMAGDVTKRAGEKLDFEVKDAEHSAAALKLFLTGKFGLHFDRETKTFQVRKTKPRDRQAR